MSNSDTQSRSEHGSNTEAEIADRIAETTNPPLEPLTLIPDEHIETRPDDVDVAIQKANELAARVNLYFVRGQLRMPTMRMAPTSSRKRGPTPRACLADRIAEFGLEDVLYTLERFAVICVHEPDQRKWWCPDMFSPTRWPPIRSTVASGTGKRFRNDRERTEYETRTGGRHDWPSVPRNVIVAGERIDDGPMDYMDDSKIPF